VVRGAFRRIVARLSPSGATHAFVMNAHSVPHPCARRESDSLPRLGSGRHAALVTTPHRRLSAPAGSRDKMLLSDFCNQRVIHAHAKRSIPERGAFAATDRPRAR
jgi:hypothetical protein